ncbi:hypothetical protein ECC02_010595 [Trypanosoma cruzi]|uniref:Mucin TcMUC n=1 Tax=Trypanosoma cruzi TaxID=5693 RepID=A0A7J6XQZ7_TRYCR|nr:hypothetical protein ECC02_010595 [Trypanosoma cruzi]
MPFHAPINRSEGASWCVGVHSHIYISTAINGEESGVTATKGKTNIYCNTLTARSRKNKNRIIGCTSRGPTIHVVRGSPFLLLLCFCVAVCAAPPLVCVRTLREGCRHDGPLLPYAHAVEPCVPLLFASPSSICVLVLRQGCVLLCVPAACGLECVSCVVCGVRCMPGCCPLLMWCALCVCVSAAPLVSPVALHVPHCADQLHTTERPHSR